MGKKKDKARRHGLAAAQGAEALLEFRDAVQAFDRFRRSEPKPSFDEIYERQRVLRIHGELCRSAVRFKDLNGVFVAYGGVLTAKEAGYVEDAP